MVSRVVYQVQIILLLLWIFAMAVHRVCDKVQEGCIYVWLFVQHRGDKAEEADVGRPLSSLGNFKRVPESGADARVLVEDP